MRLPPGCSITIEDAPDAKEVEVLPDGLEAFNQAAWPGHQPWQDLAVMLRQDGKVVGGLAGASYAGWLFVKYLWISAAFRRLRLGSELMRLAEERAAARGCHGIWLDTFSFQAPGFYEKLGFERFGELDHPPAGKRYFYRKSLLP